MGSADGMMKFEKLGRKKNPTLILPRKRLKGTNQGKYSVFNYQSTLCRPYNKAVVVVWKILRTMGLREKKAKTMCYGVESKAG